ncbi:MAG: pentapeptide repeat-containing protein [Hapalosiphonaceae cyanobacterium JJU2]|nr:MAG: pentapeptide repeat-containing protein [Hapalosiphonaceae cyanobacterium JJU2]
MIEDFSHQNLRGQSFKDKNLQGSNFSHADIRSANFTNANLKNANFSHVKAGLKPDIAVLLLNIAFVCLALSGFALELGVRAVLANLDSKPITSVTVFFLLVTFCIVTILRGLAGAALVTVTIAIIVTVVGAGVGIGSGPEADAITGAIIGVVTIALVGLEVVAVSIAGTVAMAIAGITTITGVVASTLVGTSVAVITGIVDQATVVVVAITGIATILGVYTAIRALAGEQKFAFIKSIAIGFASIGGTIFRGADLTDANFSKAMLKNTDLRKANINCTCWFQATKLDLARVGASYLEKPQVQQLLTTGIGIGKNFDSFNLRSVNLQRANLTDASFIGADLSEANLQDADLSRAKLKQTQLDATDLTGATLTGAYIQDWGITSEGDPINKLAQPY